MSVLCPVLCVLFFLWLDLVYVGCGRYSESMVTRRGGGDILKTFQVELFYGVVGVWARQESQ